MKAAGHLNLLLGWLWIMLGFASGAIMKNRQGSRHSLPTTQKLTIIAQDPAVRRNGRILTAEIEIPAEEILAATRRIEAGRTTVPQPQGVS